jgi:hypothetical protein
MWLHASAPASSARLPLNQSAGQTLTARRTRLRTQFITSDGTNRQIRESCSSSALDVDVFPLSALVPASFIDARLPAVVDAILARGDRTRPNHPFEGLSLVHITTPLDLADGHQLDVFFPLAWRSSRAAAQPTSPQPNYGVVWTHYAIEHQPFLKPALGLLPLTAIISPHLRHHHGDATAEALARVIAPLHFHQCGFSAIGTYHPLRWGTFVTGYDPASAELELQDFVGDLITVA